MRKQFQKISKYRPSIFQASLDFSATRRGMSLSVAHPLENTALKTLFAVLVVFLCAYLYFVGASVLNIMARKEASVNTQRLQSSVAVMEQEYFALGKSVDAETAGHLGLAPVSGTSYVYRTGNAAAAGVVARNEI